jgi:D-tyrosyl-tRNA(Tyr) deacylase
MRAVVQRVKRAEVRVNSSTVGSIGAGLLVLLGIGKEDTVKEAESLADKIVNLRIFDDEEGRMNRSLAEEGGGLLCVSQFTLYGDCRKGRRPGYDHAAPPDISEGIYVAFVEFVRARGIPVETGQFRARMEVELVNDGPVTLLLDTERIF